MRSIPSLLIVCSLLAGCASLSKEECVQGNWEVIGSNDASEGQPASRFADHQKACDKYDVKPVQADYLKGYKKGLVNYCTPTNGFNVGRNGYKYNSICPATTEAEFMRGYLRGRSLHEIETAIAELQRQIDDLDWHEGNIIKTPDGKKKKHHREDVFLKEQQLRFELMQLRMRRDQELILSDEFLRSVAPDI
jgi:hypothetical protein